MAACAACQTAFTQEQRGLKCTLCDERRVAEPAYYCDQACQKRHWPEHKAFHARLEITDQRIRENGYDYENVKSKSQDSYSGGLLAGNEQFTSLLTQGDQARLRGEYREAVKRAKKAIALAATN